jgi:Lipocalin-like domain
MPRMSLIIAMICVASPLLWSRAATPRPATDQFKGTWALVSIRYVSTDGSVIEPFGPNAKGMLVFDGTRFATQVIAANLPKFASHNRMVGTPQEYEATSHGVVAYFGTYTVNEANRILTLHIERSSFPNWEGTDQQRKFEFVGDELRYTAASSTANPAEAAQLVWKRGS